MIIVLYHVSGLSADEQSVLSDCISRNGVPVFAIGSDSIALVRSVLMYSQEVLHLTIPSITISVKATKIIVSTTRLSRQAESLRQKP